MLVMAAPTPTTPTSTLTTTTFSYGPDPIQRFDVVRATPRAGKGQRGAPIVIFFHGGVWQFGTRKDGLGLVATLAEHGYVGVTASYRLAPTHRAPAQHDDAVAAVAAVVAHAAEFGGDLTRVIVMGHSAGGQLASMLVFDDVARAKSTPAPGRVVAVIALSGVFDLRAPLDEQLPDGGASRFVAPAFGRDVQTLRRFSPIDHIHPVDVPFLLVTATGDYGAMRDQSATMQRALVAKGIKSTLVTVADHDHFGLVSDFGDDGDAVAAAVLSFLEAQGLGPPTRP